MLLSADKGRESILVLLDYSAAFDTINHDILLQRLSDRFGFCDTALHWFTSYYTNRSQHININGHLSEAHIPEEGVPQGSVIGPLAFTLYTSPIENIIDSYGLSKMIYADDTHVYMQ